MKNWKIPMIILCLLLLSFVFRWEDLGSTTNKSTTVRTKFDHWNGSVWQTTIKNGSYTEEIVSPSWFETSRKSVEKQVEYQEPIYSKPSGADMQANRFSYLFDNVMYVTKIKTIQVPPSPIYWLSSNGLTRIWIYITSFIGVWLIIAVVINGRRKENNIKK